MKPYLILIIVFYSLFNTAFGQSPSAAIDSLIKFQVIVPKERPALNKELSNLGKKGRASYRVAILAGLYSISLQKIFHIDPHKTGLFYSYGSDYLHNKSQDSINTSLRQLLEKIKKANLLTERVYDYALKEIDSSRYVADLQMMSRLTEMSSRLEWLAPDKLRPVAEELHKNSIVSDSSFLRLKDDINNGKIESAFQLNDYCRYDRVFDMTKYPDDPGIWLEQVHRDIASILPGLEFTDFKYTEVPDTSFSLPGVKFKISLTCNGRTYKHLSLAINNYKKQQSTISPKDIHILDFYRIFNKVLTDQQSPYRLHNIMFTHYTSAYHTQRFALIALKDTQQMVFMKDPCMSYMLASMDNYDSELTSAKIDSALQGWEKMGLFKHLSKAEIDKALDDARSADPFSTSGLLSNFQGVVYDLHDSFTGPRHPYRNILMSLAKITHGAFSPAKITQIKAGRGLKLQYLSGGKIHSFTFPTTYGWFDVKLPAFIKGLSRENNLPGNFYQLKYGDSVIYLTKQQHDYAVKYKLLEFPPATKQRRL